MASRISPYVDNTGLVFAYDLANIKRSYLGEPTVNYVPDTYGYGAYAYVSGPVDTSTVNEKGDSTTVKRYTITNAINTARAAIRPSGLTTGVAYTFSFKWKYNGTTTTSPSIEISAFKGYPEGGANNNGFTSQTSDTVSIGNGWYLTTYTFVFSSNPTGASILTFGISTGSTAGFVGETFDIYEAQFEIKNHKTQYSNGTRSATQGLKDLTGNSTIDLTNVSFDANAQMTFDGTNDSLVVGNNAVLKNNNSSIEFLIKYLNTPNGDIIQFGVGSGTYAQYYYRAYSGYSYWNWYPVGTGYGEIAIPNAALPLNKYHHIIMTGDDQGYVQFYINGTLQTGATRTANSQPANWTPADLTVGGFSWDGYSSSEIPYLKIYNRVLATSEIQQNFNAIKGRYGF